MISCRIEYHSGSEMLILAYPLLWLQLSDTVGLRTSKQNCQRMVVQIWGPCALHKPVKTTDSTNKYTNLKASNFGEANLYTQYPVLSHHSSLFKNLIDCIKTLFHVRYRSLLYFRMKQRQSFEV